MTQQWQGDGDRLIHLFGIQQAALTAMAALFVPDVTTIPRATYEAYFSAARGLLRVKAKYVADFPGSFEIQDDAEPFVQHLTMCADAADARGERADAARLRAEAYQMTDRYLTGVRAARVHRGRARDAAMAGRFQDALAGLEDARAAFVEGGSTIEAALTAADEANVLEWLCAWDRALAGFEGAAVLVADLPPVDPTLDPVGAERLLGLDLAVRQGRARMARRLGDLHDARRLWGEVRGDVEALAPGGADFHLAWIALETGDIWTAENLVERIAPLFDGGRMRSRRASLQVLRADLALRRGRPREALAAAVAGLKDQPQFPDPDNLWKLSWRQARALAALGDHAAALKAYARAASDADTLRMVPLGYELDSAFIRDKLPMLREAVDAAVAAGDGAAVVRFVELAKARALAALVVHGPDPQGGKETAARAARLDALSQRIDALSWALWSGDGDGATAAERDQLVVERRALLERIRLRDPRWRTVTEPPPLDVPAAASRLAADDRVGLVLQLHGPRVVAAVLGAGVDGVVAAAHEVSPTTLTAIQQFAANLLRPMPDPFLSDLSGETGVGLDDLLPDLVADALTSALEVPKGHAARTLLVVPHDVLHLLPWSAMTLHGSRLVQQAAVGVLPTLGVLDRLDASGDVRRVALLGDPDYTSQSHYRPLTQAAGELDDLESLYGAAGLVAPAARGPEATEAALDRLLGLDGVSDAVLHLACHGDLEAADPLSSGLVLTRSVRDAAQAAARRCPYPEVVLSACSTGWRPQRAHGVELLGDDALGLVAAFLEAGARTLVVSVTRAKDDVARQFAVSWHRHRKAGQSPVAAGRSAQLELLLLNPDAVWTWAGTTVYGCR